MTPVFGEFLGPAGEHIAAAASFDGQLSFSAQSAAVCQLDRLTTIFLRYLADLPLPDALEPARDPERNPAARTNPGTVALAHVSQILHPAAAVTTVDGADERHPLVAHLTAAADYLAAGHDLLQTHFVLGPDDTISSNPWWAPAVTSSPVIAALLAQLAEYTDTLAQCISRLPGLRPGQAGIAASALPALRAAHPWLVSAGTNIFAALAHYPAPAGSLLAAIPVNVPPPRQQPGDWQTISELCQRIPLTAERLRYAACTFTARAGASPAITSRSWRRDALASAITTHLSELILRSVAERASHLGIQPAFPAWLNAAADSMGQACRSWRLVTGQWDILTTGAPRGTGLTPVATEIQDLVLQTGRLAYHDPHWNPAAAKISPRRDPATLAGSASDVTTVLSAIHHATDALTRIATQDHQTAQAAADDNRLYVPVRLLPMKYDIPSPYTQAPREHLDALTTAYDNAIETAERTIAILDDLAITLDSPSKILAIARRASIADPPGHDPHVARHPAPQTPTAATVPGPTEQTLLKLQIRDPALLERAAIIDQAARDLVAAATAKAQVRDKVTRLSWHWPASALAADRSGPVHVACQDVPLTATPGRPFKDPPAPAAPNLRHTSHAQTPVRSHEQGYRGRIRG